MKRIALFASGTGTNVQNLLEKAKLYPNLHISCVIVDTLTSPLPVRLKFGYPELPVHVILPDEKLPKEIRKNDFELNVCKVLSNHQVEWILLAGYMRLVGPTLLSAFKNKIVNIHPSLLPSYPGLHAYERAFQEGVAESGITIHLVDEGMDTGPIILQKSFPRFESDTLSDFISRGKDLEWEMYPEILKLLNVSANLPGV